MWRVLFGFASLRFWILCAITTESHGIAAPFTNFVNFETALVHPIALAPDGITLAVCNLPDNSVELFDVVGGT